MRDLNGILGGRLSRAVNQPVSGINNAGHIVGSATFNGETRAFIYRESRVAPLTARGEIESDARAVNNKDEVVGDAMGYGFLWHNGRCDRLSSLIPSDSGWSEPLAAEDINDAGVIIGMGPYKGTLQPFMMTPVGLPGR